MYWTLRIFNVAALVQIPKRLVNFLWFSARYPSLMKRVSRPRASGTCTEEGMRYP